MKLYPDFELSNISVVGHDEFVYSMFGYDFYLHSEEVIDVIAGKRLDEQHSAVIKQALYALRYNLG